MAKQVTEDNIKYLENLPDLYAALRESPSTYLYIRDVTGRISYRVHPDMLRNVKRWAAGSYDHNPTLVVNADLLYVLKYDTSLPFTSSNFATELAAGTWVMVGGSAGDYLDLNPVSAPPPYLEGRLFYDDIKKAVVLYDDVTDTSLELSYEIPIRAENQTGNTIANGTIVYINGATAGGVPTVGIADRNSYVKSRVIAMATHDVVNGALGKFTWFGIVHELPATGFSLGDTAYLGDNGAITSTEGIGGVFTVRIGTIIKVDASTVDIQLSIYSSEHTEDLTKERGFPDKANLQLAFDNGTRTLTASAADAISCRYYQGGTLHFITTPKTYQITNTEGAWFFYINNEVLTAQHNPTTAQTESIIRNNVPVAYVWWDVDNQRLVFFGREPHYSAGYGIENHIKDHLTEGARFGRGLALNTITANGDGSLAAHARFGTDAGFIFDEDLKHDISAVLPTTGFSHIYYTNAAGYPRYEVNAGYPVLTTGTGRLAYNPAGSGLVECSDNSYVWYHTFGCGANANVDRMVSFVGRSQFASQALAWAGINVDILAVQQNGLPSPEFKAIASELYQTRNVYANAVNARIVDADADGSDYHDWRLESLSGGGGTGGSGGVVTPSFSDSDFEIFDNADITKKVKVEVSGITTATTRTVTMPDKNGTMAMLSDLNQANIFQLWNTGVTNAPHDYSVWCNNAQLEDFTLLYFSDLEKKAGTPSEGNIYNIVANSAGSIVKLQCTTDRTKFVVCRIDSIAEYFTETLYHQLNVTVLQFGVNFAANDIVGVTFIGGGGEDYENVIFREITPEYAAITRPYAWNISTKTDTGGTSTITTAADAAYTLSTTVSAGAYLKVAGDTLNMTASYKINRV